MATGGLCVLPTHDFATVPPIELFVVPGGFGSRPLLDNVAVLDWIRRTAAHASYVTSVCTGSLLLAATGLLRGCRATAHWGAVGLFSDPRSDDHDRKRASRGQWRDYHVCGRVRRNWYGIISCWVTTWAGCRQWDRALHGISACACSWSKSNRCLTGVCSCRQPVLMMSCRGWNAGVTAVLSNSLPHLSNTVREVASDFSDFIGSCTSSRRYAQLERANPESAGDCATLVQMFSCEMRTLKAIQNGWVLLWTALPGSIVHTP